MFKKSYEGSAIPTRNDHYEQKTVKIYEVLKRVKEYFPTTSFRRLVVVFVMSVTTEDHEMTHKGHLLQQTTPTCSGR